ncbi:MAG: ABC transporter ATP-binding protein [Alphaproteobacteria bacterium]|nr:ABC transporter ATP-binding protein [Alphaproteobacteria bacterium]
MTPVAIHLANVTKHYPRHKALDEVSLQVPEGRCLALLGHNGAGKTTLMKLMLGLIRPSSGQVQVLGMDPAAAGLPFRRRIGFLPENVAFDEAVSGRDTLRFYARLKGVPLADTDPLLEAVGLSFAAQRRIKTYSKGMRQRLGLAQAMLGAPGLLLFDEPTTGLDPVLRQAFFHHIRDLTTRGATVVLSSHVLTELEARTDLVAILRQGRLVAFGTLDDLRREAALPVRVRVVVGTEASVVAGRLGDGLAVTVVDGRSLEITCRIDEKMAVFRHLTASGLPALDIDIQLPTLDDIYLHFSHHTAEATA